LCYAELVKNKKQKAKNKKQKAKNKKQKAKNKNQKIKNKNQKPKNKKQNIRIKFNLTLICSHLIFSSALILKFQLFVLFSSGLIWYSHLSSSSNFNFLFSIF
jgi:cation transport ATPase